jgi:hypothetical protein
VVTWVEWAEASGLTLDTITARVPAGTVATGTTWTTHTVDQVVVQAQSKRVSVATDQAAGGIAVSTALVIAPPSPLIPVGSTLTMADGTTTRVLTSALVGAHGLPLPEHQELDCG